MARTTAASENLRFLTARLLAERAAIWDSTAARARCWGRSSDELALYGIGAIEAVRCRPYDASDLNACRRTYAMAPPWAKERMRPVLDEWTLLVAEDYPEVLASTETAP